jgi:hypothetical protein
MTMKDMDWLPALALLSGAVISVGSWLINRRDDRNAITNNVEAHGGKVIGILRIWGGGSRWERAYDVNFITRGGANVEASCRTDGAAVYWLDGKPPGE